MRIDCKNIEHPFLTDPGTSQSQRVMTDLLAGPAKIDARTLADLLLYFKQLSKQINFYDVAGDNNPDSFIIKDWQPFFENSIPFVLAGITRFDIDNINDTITSYHKRFIKSPSKSGLQLLTGFIFKNLILPVNTWYTVLNNTGLPAELAVQDLIKNNLQDTLKQFICLKNTAAKWIHTKQIDCSGFYSSGSIEDNIWGLDYNDLYNINYKYKKTGKTKKQRLVKLYDSVEEIAAAFLNVAKLMQAPADMSLDMSFEGLRDELKQKHTPHLALIFSFLKLFSYLQGDLNQYTKKHLDFFYSTILQLKPKGAEPDKVHVVFEIQKQLDNYLLEKGLLLKDGKDNNKAEVHFALDDEIVVNKAQVTDVRTLFVSNEDFPRNCGTCVEYDSYVQGVYMAPSAVKADGVSVDFKGDNIHSWPTVGARESKFTDPENNFIKPYPNARIGFVLSSAVLLLNEGKRTIDIKLSCELEENYCSELVQQGPDVTSCCDGAADPAGNPGKSDQPHLVKADELYKKVYDALTNTYYYINQDLIKQAVKAGISKDTEQQLRNYLTVIITKDPDDPAENKEHDDNKCYCDESTEVYERTINVYHTTPALFQNPIVAGIFKPRRIMNAVFSGKKSWIIPHNLPKIDFSFAGLPASTLPAGRKFDITISTTLEADEAAITFYDKNVLKEDIDVTLPSVKIELDDKIKLDSDEIIFDNDGSCCIHPVKPHTSMEVSLYHFFRNVLVQDTNITVKVCELKNFVVQNDESVQDVNKPVYPFGTRPEAGSSTAPDNGSNFYISSKEVFCKNWEEFRIRFSWKDKPAYLEKYYLAYQEKNIGVSKTDFREDAHKCICSFIEDGIWKPYDSPNKKMLFFDTQPGGWEDLCPDITNVGPALYFERSKLALDPYAPQDGTFFTPEIYNNSTRNFFLRLRLYDDKGLAFNHSRYSFVLARQMMAFGKLPDQVMDEAVYYDQNGDPVVISTTDLLNELQLAQATTALVKWDVNQINSTSGAGTGPIPPPQAIYIRSVLRDGNIPTSGDPSLVTAANALDDTIIKDTVKALQDHSHFAAIIPNEPWTPIMQGMSIDYIATASITDICLTHLYPFDGTYKKEELQTHPAMFPTFCDEGNLYLGLTALTPGSNVNVLFQLAEATADTESSRVDVAWYYLDNNTWKEMRKGFEVLDDGTDNLSASGIIKYAVPANISAENTIMPKGTYWIKAAIAYNSKIVAETIGIYAQAAKATFTNEDANDKMRLAAPLAAGSVSKLQTADANVKKVSQPYDSFGGRIPDSEGYYYVRTSELLRHKGRAIQKFDYERMVLDAFPNIFKAKCINHSFGLDANKYIADYYIAPGYVLLAVIPDMNILKAAQSFEPRVPLSELEQIEAYFKKRNSPFVRLRAMNPRYEKVNFCLKVKLIQGKDENYYKEKLKDDIRAFMAPWAIGEFDKLAFGQAINFSDVIRFLEIMDYVDYIVDFRWSHEDDLLNIAPIIPTSKDTSIQPHTPRSILIAGEIDVCIVAGDCNSWDIDNIDQCEHLMRTNNELSSMLKNNLKYG